MRAGPLRKRVTFEEAAETPDGGGGFETAWGRAITVWGQFIPERGAERLAADRLEATMSGVLRVRASSELSVVTEAWRVMIDGEPHQIRSIANPDQRRRFLEMTVERGTAV